jgi:hypothetical protein
MKNEFFRRNVKIQLNKAQSLIELKRAPKQLAAGLAIMLLSSVAGGVILNTQNKTETLLVLNRDVAAGDSLSSEYFDSREVLVSTLNGQWLTPDQIHDGTFFAISLSKGDALRAADVSEISSDLRLISFAVEETDLPTGIRAGDLLDFWEVGLGDSKLLATYLSVQSASLKESRGLIQLGLLVTVNEVDEVLKAISNESFRLVVSL